MFLIKDILISKIWLYHFNFNNSMRNNIYFFFNLLNKYIRPIIEMIWKGLYISFHLLWKTNHDPHMPLFLNEGKKSEIAL